MLPPPPSVRQLTIPRERRAQRSKTTGNLQTAFSRRCCGSHRNRGIRRSSFQRLYWSFRRLGTARSVLLTGEDTEGFPTHCLVTSATYQPLSSRCGLQQRTGAPFARPARCGNHREPWRARCWGRQAAFGLSGHRIARVISVLARSRRITPSRGPIAMQALFADAEKGLPVES